MLTIETDQGPFLLKGTPTKAHFRSGTVVGRCWAALEDHNGESIEIHTVLLGFLQLADRTDRAGRLGGWGAYRLCHSSWLEFPAPCGCGPWLWAAGCGAAANN